MFAGDSPLFGSHSPLNIRRRDYASDLLLPTQNLTSLTSSIGEEESKRKKHAMVFIAFIVVLQNIADFSISVNMAWMAAVVSNGTCNWFTCKQPDIHSGSHIKFNLSSTLEGALATLLYHILIAVFSVVGGYLGDAKIGRYKSIQLSLIFTIIGSALYLTLSLILIQSKSTRLYLEQLLTDPGYFILTVILLLFGIAMCAVGAGLHNANIIPFGAEQFSFDMEAKIEYFFYSFYWFRNLGCFITNLFVALLQQYRCWIGFSVPLVASLLSIIPLTLGKKYFILNFPRSDVTDRFFKIIREGYKFSKVPTGGGETNFTRISTVDRLDFAKHEYGGSYSTLEVNSVKSVLKLVPLFSCYIIYFTIYSQMHSSFYIQGLFIKTPDYFPYAGAEIANNIAILVLLPLFILVVYPKYEKKFGTFHAFSKIQIGFFFAAIAMITAGFVEYVRHVYLSLMYNEASFQTIYLHSGVDVVVLQALDFWVRFPQYFFIAVSEIFAVVIGIEFAYKEGPRTMRSITMGVFFMYNALGTFASAVLMLLIQVVTLAVNNGYGWICQDYNQGKMHYFFFLLSGLMIANMVCFMFRAKRYEKTDSYW